MGRAVHNGNRLADWGANALPENESDERQDNYPDPNPDQIESRFLPALLFVLLLSLCLG